jgi:SAM-dependent methyltransferase
MVHDIPIDRSPSASASAMARLTHTMKAVAKHALGKETRIALRRLRYAGGKYRCNVCGNGVRTMFTIGLPFPVLRELDVVGAETQANDMCPICFSNCRVRLLYEYIRSETGVFDPSRRPKVFHVAPEYGIMSRMRSCATIDYLGVDLNPASTREGAPVERCDITGIGYPADRFDLIICSHVLEHIPNDRLAMRELCRILKPGGDAVMQVPISAALSATIEDPSVTDPQERERRFGQYDHVRIYGADYPDRLREAGFTVDVFDPTSRWGAARVAELRLNPRERVFVGRK